MTVYCTATDCRYNLEQDCKCKKHDIPQLDQYGRCVDFKLKNVKLLCRKRLGRDIIKGER